MEVVACVREDELRLEPTAEIGEDLLHSRRRSTEGTVAEAVHLDNDAGGRAEKCLGARASLLLARRRRR